MIMFECNSASAAGPPFSTRATTNPDNAKANIAAAEKGPLPDYVVAKIRDAFHRADPGHGWKGQT